MILRRLAWFVSLTLILIVSAHRLPAPISEIQEPSIATPSPKKPKSIGSESDSNSSSKGRFDGTWAGPDLHTDTKDEHGVYHATNTTVTLFISGGRSAVLTLEFTETPPPGGTWLDLPPPVNASPFSARLIYHSLEFSATNSVLSIHWSAPKVSDWQPKEIPSSFRQKFETNIANWQKTPRGAAVYTLKGDTLTLENGPSGKIAYKRGK